MDTDLELLTRYRGGDVQAMDLLVDRHAGAVYAFVRRFLGDPTVAEDMTQEVWLRVLRRSGSFNGRARFTTWLFTVTRNTCIDHLRRKRRRSPAVPASERGEPFQLDDLQDPGPPIVERVARQELSELVERAVAELPEAQREVFLLREQTELTFREIADALELPRDTVKSRMRYALGHIRRFVRRNLGKEVQASGL